ncbi:UPF0488 protein CG14286 [Microplitis mediator]|uniref:UPF0488 protein CG14286 n=1 Tax=Microplitis mediator TaxID=375433 RepID=UPI002555EF84|nr:UPF0488 protein CG14286 [Microplitis mediator]
MPPKFKPGGKRFPPKVTPKSHPPQAFHDTPASTSSPGLDEESENKFELELCWCIQQLELGIQSGKLKDKQLKDTVKNLNSLKSNSVALVQKRQIMRSTFGDYRLKMIEEEKKLGKSVTQVKFSSVKAKEKSVFLRKSHCSDNEQSSSSLPSTSTSQTNGEQTTESSQSLSSLFRKKPTNETFAFNFNNSDT